MFANSLALVVEPVAGVLIPSSLKAAVWIAFVPWLQSSLGELPFRFQVAGEVRPSVKSGDAGARDGGRQLPMPSATYTVVMTVFIKSEFVFLQSSSPVAST